MPSLSLNCGQGRTVVWRTGLEGVAAYARGLRPRYSPRLGFLRRRWEEPTGGALATERWAERGARDGMRPARRQLRQREGRRASWVPQAIQCASQPRSASVSSNRGLAGGRAAGWLRCEAIDFSPGRGPSPLLMRPMRVAGFPEVSASTILPWLQRGRWIRARPNGWACRSDQGLGPRRRAGRSPSGREAPDQRQAEDSSVGAESDGRRRTPSRTPPGRAGR